jgi:regulator of protease activity HflC (stomatin/prohibitin superfamily)
MNITPERTKSALRPYAVALYRVAVAAMLLFALNASLRLMNQFSDTGVLAGVFLFAVTVVFACWWVNRTFHSFTEWIKRAADKIAMSALILAVFGLTGCYAVIPPGHAGIVVQQTGTDRGVQQIPVETGRVFYNPINEDVLDYPTFVQRAIWTASANEEIAFQSSDSLHFTGDVAVAYQLMKEKVPAFYVQFRSDDLATFTHGFFRDAVRKSIGLAAQNYTQEQINGGKQADLEAEAQKTLTASMAPYGVQIVQLAFTSPPRPPDAVKLAIQGKVAAIQRAEQIENEKRQAVAEGAKNVAYAEAQAKANSLITSSITPQLIQWEEIKVMQSKWDGKMPMVQGSAGGLMLNLPK